MKTTYTIIAILAILLFTQTATAKLGDNRSTVQLESKASIEAEIVKNINNMLANVEAPTIKTDAAKQIGIDTVEVHTNTLVQNVKNTLPEFKFKVVLAD